MRRPTLIVACAAMLTAGCTPRPEQPSADSIRAARQAALQFDQRITRDIIQRLQRNEDVVAVWLAYADHVPDWGREIGNELEIAFSRTALGVRNPANEPDDWERLQMELMSFMLDTGIDPETMEVAEIRQEGEEKVFRWMRPILMAEECLVCHGEQIDNRVKLLIGQEFPLDDATGYSPGQLGGAYSVRQVLSIAGKPPPPWQDIPAPVRAPPDQRSPDDAPVIAPPAAPAPEPF